MAGAPDVITNAFQQQSRSDPMTDSVAAAFREKQIIQQIPVYGSTLQFSVPPVYYNRGWVAPDVPTVAGPTYPRPVQAPEITYLTKAYSNLIALSAKPPVVQNRQAVQLTAPSIDTTY